MPTISQSPFTPVVGWEQLPKGYLHRDGTDVSVDSHDRVYFLTRYAPRVIVFERTGEFVMSWGEDILSNDPHGITIGPDDLAYVADRGAHVVRKFTLSGTQLAIFGTEGIASDTGFDPTIKDPFERESKLRGGPPFNRPTKVAIAPGGDIYVSDGYGNARIHHLSPNGVMIKSWGSPGAGPGQFRLPHCVRLTEDNRLLVADRENGRIQVFTLDGQLLDVWSHVQRPESLTIDPQGNIYLSEAPDGPPNPSMGYQGTQSRSARLSVLDRHGHVLESYEGGSIGECHPGNFLAISGIAIDSDGDLYICQNTDAARRSMGLEYDPDCPAIQKLARRK